jgi:IS30 family transposase
MECGMERKFHRGFTAAEKTELWDRRKRGESLKAVGRAFGKESSLIYFLVAPHGHFRTHAPQPSDSHSQLVSGVAT